VFGGLAAGAGRIGYPCSCVIVLGLLCGLGFNLAVACQVLGLGLGSVLVLSWGPAAVSLSLCGLNVGAGTVSVFLKSY
jgi:hypothetical protein